MRVVNDRLVLPGSDRRYCFRIGQINVVGRKKTFINDRPMGDQCNHLCRRGVKNSEAQ